jgi:signal transduction histidine kinase
LANLTIRRQRQIRNSSVWIVVLIWICAALTRAFTSIAIISAVGVLRPAVLEVVAISLSGTLSIFFIMTVLISRISDLNSQIVDFRRIQSELVSLQVQAQDFVIQQQALLTQTIKDQIVPELERLTNNVRSLSRLGIADLATEIADFSENVVRGLSSQIIWDRDFVNPRQVARSRTWPAWRDVRPRVVSWLVLVMILGLAVPQYLLRHLGVRDYLQLGLEVLVLWVILNISALANRRIKRDSGPVGIAICGVTYLFSAFAIFVMACWPIISGTSYSNVGNARLSAAYVLILTFLSTLLDLAQQLQASTARSLERDNAVAAAVTADLREQGLALRAQVAQALHGPLQGRLAAISMALREHASATARGDLPELAPMIIRVEEVLVMATADVAAVFGESFPASSSVSFTDRLTEIRIRWEGLVAVDVRVDTDVPPGFDRIISDVVEELVTNACRHGRAHAVEIELRRGIDGGIRVVAVDDGLGPMTPVLPGGGSALADQVGGTWEVGRNGTLGARVEVTIPAFDSSGVR